MKTLQEILDQFSQSKLGKKTEQSINRSVATTLRNTSRSKINTKRNLSGYTDERVIEDWNKGVSFQTMMKKSNLTYDSLHTLIKRLGLERRIKRIKINYVQEIITLIESGKTDSEISKITGVKRGTIYGIRKRKVKNK